MRVLIACEFTGTVRDAFRARGYDAVSCDILPTDKPGPHIQGDVREVLGDGWDLMIAHPPCTYLSVSGLHWNKRDPDRAAKTEDGLKFVCDLLNAPIRFKAIENPVSCISTRITRMLGGRFGIVPAGMKSNKRFAPLQTVQPNEFGADASKRTCFWEDGGLPPLPKDPALYVPGRVVEYNGKLVERWANQADSGQNRLGPSEDRWAERSKTYPGIAEAMAKTWGDYVFNIVSRAAA